MPSFLGQYLWSHTSQNRAGLRVVMAPAHFVLALIRQGEDCSRGDIFRRRPARRHGTAFRGHAAKTGPYCQQLHGRNTNKNTKPVCNARISQSQKKRNRRYKRRLLLGVISVCGGKEVAFKITLKTIDTSCSTTIKRQVISDLWHTNRKCLVSHDKRRVRTAKQQFVRRSQTQTDGADRQNRQTLDKLYIDSNQENGK